MGNTMPVLVALTTIIMLGLPLSALANPGNGNGGIGNGNARHGGAPLPVIGVGLPGVAVAGAAYLLYRRKSTGK